MLSKQVITAAIRSSAPRTAVGRMAPAIHHIRSYAQPASSPDTKPPVAVYGLDGTYASALVCIGTSILYKEAAADPNGRQ